MSCLNFISGLATGIWQDIGEPPDLSVSTIFSKLSSSGMLGELDALINTCHTFNESGCIEPSLNGEEISIYQKIYYLNFYKKKSVQAISIGNGLGSSSWISIDEADTKIRRTNPVEISKVYKDLAKQTESSLNDLVSAYRMNRSFARDISFYGIDQYGNNYPLGDNINRI